MERGKWHVGGRGIWQSILHRPFSFLRSPLFRWGTALLWMAGIFYFSSRSHPLGPLSRSEHSGLVGRIAHFVEYAGLTILLHRVLVGDEQKRRTCRASDLSETDDPEITAISIRPSLAAPAIALAYAVFDELHQELVPGRGFALADIGYDLAGIAAGLGLIWMRAFVQRRLCVYN